MKKVTAFVGSASKKNTYKCVAQFLNKVQVLGDIEYEIVILNNYNLGICRGCRLCFLKGEEFCPLKDDRDLLMAKIEASDGVIFASPNYTWQMSGVMKMFLDRFGFACHRPRYFGKVFTSIVTQGFSGGNKIVDYFDFLAQTLGFNTIKGTCVTMLFPMSEKDEQKVDEALTKLSKQFHAKLTKPAYPVPSWPMLMGFRMGRTSVREMLDDSSLDYRYYARMGWFESDYFYPIQLGPLKKAAGRLFDRITPTIRKMIA
jgi:multimeric flavodoxin WrbA